MSLSFCEEIQNKTEEQFCTNPIWNFPSRPTSVQIATPVFEVPTRILPNGNKQFIYVGTYDLSANLLQMNGIAGVLNVAYDVNDAKSLQQTLKTKKIEKDGTETTINYLSTQLSKVGLIDGPENNVMTLLAALYMADQLLDFLPEEKQLKDDMVNIYPQGNLLIHCHDGGSRSVTVAALYIYYKFYTNQSIYSFEDFYYQIICYRWSAGAVNDHPTLGICQTAIQLLNTFSEIFPKPVYR